ncbi:MAG: flavin reductase family protein [Alcaligenaceae bacterium]|nr:flavin reductase family protein [Alcaligenaceae bacterium]
MIRLQDDTHSYTPTEGHGLAHDPINAIVGPRPIGWIGTKSNAGVLNLAPFSFFNLFNYKPPVLIFSAIGHKKDTINNVLETGEFTWNLVSRGLAEQMNLSCISEPLDEFTFAKLTPLRGDLVEAPRVAESPVTMECKLLSCEQLKDIDGVLQPTWIAMGQVVRVHIARQLIDENNIYQAHRVRRVLRAGGPADYYEILEDGLFKMSRPDGRNK